MQVAILAVALFSITLLVHWVVWRIRPPQRQTAALLAIFFAALPLGLLATLLPPARDWFDPLGVWAYLHVSIFHVAMSLAYVVAYSAIEERSPSMTLLLYVAASEPRGRTRDELRDVLRATPPVERRLDAMLRDKLLDQAGGAYRLTSKGWAWSRVFALGLRLLNKEKGG